MTMYKVGVARSFVVFEPILPLFLPQYNTKIEQDIQCLDSIYLKQIFREYSGMPYLPVV